MGAITRRPSSRRMRNQWGNTSNDSTRLFCNAPWFHKKTYCQTSKKDSDRASSSIRSRGRCRKPTRCWKSRRFPCLSWWVYKRQEKRTFKTKDGCQEKGAGHGEGHIAKEKQTRKQPGPYLNSKSINKSVQQLHSVQHLEGTNLDASGGKKPALKPQSNEGPFGTEEHG